MDRVETYYLIDYENVGAEGLLGCDKLVDSDHIIIFFTKNAKKIDMSDIANHGRASLEMKEVPAGKQSTDIHIGSYLGYLVGKYEISEHNPCNVVIISKDTDYDNVIKFWEDKIRIKASRMLSIKNIKSENKGISTEKQEVAKVEKKKTCKIDGNIKTKLNQEIMKAIKNAGFGATVVNEVASIVAKKYGKESLLSVVHNELKTIYPNYQEIYKAIKPVLSTYAQSATPNQNNKMTEKGNGKKQTSKKNDSDSNNKVNVKSTNKNQQKGINDKKKATVNINVNYKELRMKKVEDLLAKTNSSIVEKKEILEIVDLTYGESGKMIDMFVQKYGEEKKQKIWEVIKSAF